MAFKYDMDKIFGELEREVKKYIKYKNEVDEEKENNPIESPDDAPETQEVAPATSKTTEDKHGGDEASKEIKNSPNSVNDGENAEKENKSEKTKNTGQKGDGDGQSEESKKKEETTNKNSASKGEGTGIGDKQGEKEESVDEKSEKENQDENDYFITSSGTNHSKNKPSTTPEDLQKEVERLFEEKQKKQSNMRFQNTEEYIKKYILEIVKKVAAQHAGIDKQLGSELYDKKQMLQHMITGQTYKVLEDKYDLRDAKYVQFFIDTSGVYGCGSNKMINELMPEVIAILEKQGYECYIAACGNGFYERDMIEDEYYGTRKTLEGYRAGKVNKIACPSHKTAAKMASEAEFSFILADFDGLSSICYMASLCPEDKVPYFLCTEDRYPWEDPTLHDWVDPDLWKYNPELVYDVSEYGNPTLEQYEYSVAFEDYEYEEDDDYEYDD